MAAFEATEPLQYEVQWRQEDESATLIACSVVMTKSDDVPDTLPTIIGDCLTNLRAALDHAVFEHARTTMSRELGRETTEGEERNLYFPLAKTKRGLDKAKGYLAPSIYDYIASLHDFDDDWRSSKPVAQHLALLRIFVNHDKHRAVVPANQADMHLKAKTSEDQLKYLGGQFVSGEATVGEVFLTLQFQKIRPLSDVPRDQLLRELTIKFPTMLRVPGESKPDGLQIDQVPPPTAVERLQGMCDAVCQVLDELERLGV